MNRLSPFATLTQKRKSDGSRLGWIYSADFLSSFMFGETKQSDSFRRGRQRRASGKNTMGQALPSAHPSEEKTMKPEYDFKKAKRGAVVAIPKGKTRITIRIDDDILAWFREQVDRAGGGNYQSLMNEALSQYIRDAKEPLEATLRRVIREELSHTS